MPLPVLAAPATAAPGGRDPDDADSTNGKVLPMCTAMPKRGKRKAGSARQCCSFVFNLSYSRIVDFRLVRRLIGKEGTNMKLIAAACGGKVRIRGRGSGHREEPHGREADLPLQVALSCPDEEGFLLGRQMLQRLLQGVGGDFELHCAKFNIKAPGRFYYVLEAAEPFGRAAPGRGRRPQPRPGAAAARASDVSVAWG